MKAIYKLTLIAVFAALAGGASAQQEAMHAQNVLNLLRVNPAYAGYKETPTMSLFHRSQWVGFKGAPSTQTLSFDMPLKRGKFAFGGTLNRDKIGPTSELSLMADFAARVQVNRTGFMAFGLKATAGLFQSRLSDVALTSNHYGQQDEMFMQDAQTVFMPNVGFGFFYHDRRNFVSVSIPRLLETPLDERSSEVFYTSEGVIQPTAFFSAGRLWKLNRDFELQPTLLSRATVNAPLSVGASVNLIIKQSIKVGGFYYYKEVAGGFIQYDVNSKLKVGYSMDFMANRAVLTNFGSHELNVSYQLKAKRRRIVYPRYF